MHKLQDPYTDTPKLAITIVEYEGASTWARPSGFKPGNTTPG